MKTTAPIGVSILLALAITSPVAADPQKPPPPPPEWPEGRLRTIRARAGERVHVALRALEPGGKPLDYAATGLPGSARLTVHAGPDGSASIDWFPDMPDVGVHDVQVAARSEGRSEVQTVRIVVEEDWGGYFVPGAHYSTFIPGAVTKWGSMHGVSIEFLVAAWIHRNEQPGPSHGRIRLNLDILKSTRKEVSTSLHVSGGVDLTFERNPARRYLLPFYGLDAGVMFGKQQLTTFPQVTPLGGVHLWSGPSLFITASGGYLLPLHGQAFDELRGARARVGVDASFW